MDGQPSRAVSPTPVHPHITADGSDKTTATTIRATFSSVDLVELRIQALSLILVELTGIEPVASWLQTRRSPS